MSAVNRSEQFLYFQNKTKHYQNIRRARPTVDDKLSKSLRSTIDHSRDRSHMEPHLKRHQLDFDNQKMINRLISIVNSKRKEVNVQGDYSRYHNVRREFRSKNPYHNQVLRKIDLQNQEIVNRLSSVKPLVGSNTEWLNQYRDKITHRKNMSRYNDDQKSKASLLISAQQFIPDSYKTLIEERQDLDKSKADSRMIVIPKQKLMALPKLSKQRSNSALSRSGAKNSSTLEL